LHPWVDTLADCCILNGSDLTNSWAFD